VVRQGIAYALVASTASEKGKKVDQVH
jgi:hypothetical protein